MDTGETLLIQTDWDYPGVASTFGWSVQDVQETFCPECGNELDCLYCHNCDITVKACNHYHTDGTVDCPNCGMSAAKFIESAIDYLDSIDGKIVDDPGYFE
jgi:transcription elongation factor Elf1